MAMASFLLFDFLLNTLVIFVKIRDHSESVPNPMFTLEKQNPKAKNNPTFF